MVAMSPVLREKKTRDTQRMTQNIMIMVINTWKKVHGAMKVHSKRT